MKEQQMVTLNIFFQLHENSTNTDQAEKEANWDYFYEYYLRWGELTLTTIVPILSLIYCTIRIIVALRVQKSSDLQLGKKTSENGSANQMNGTANSSVVLRSQSVKIVER